MRLKKSFAVVLSFLLIMSIVTACSSSSSGGTDSGKITLVMWSHKDTGIEEADKQLVKAFEDSHPNIKIKFQNFPYDEYVNKLKASFSASNGPDLAEMFGTWVPQYTKNDLLLEVPNGDQYKNDFYEAPLGGYLKDGKVYGVPLEYNIENGSMLAYPDMFKDAGLEYPKTWDELVAAAKKLTVMDGKNIKVKGFDFTSYDSVTFLFLSMILQQGGDYWDSNGHINFHSPEAIKAMNEMVTLARDYKVADYKEMNYDLDSSDYFFKGESAMTMRGPWVIPAAETTYQVENFDYAPIPSFTSNPPSFASESGWGIVGNKKTKHKEAVLKYLEFVSQPENALAWNLVSHTVPAQKSVAQGPDFIKAAPMMETPLSVLEYGKYIGPIGDRDYMWDEINAAFIEMCENKTSVEDGLKKLETNINKMLDGQ
ncbi:ABC transporter substrate-binding protein [Neobacillus sp. FSL H8-0543]|uniref:ABC transporter substrate-binding protein n=1 Tax=Neobacillus sp. FSL H8-0543 TaxID=2954672 RepID=UPI0031588022